MVALRERQKRNLLATLFLSQGVPMLVAGDESGRTQGGNNNAYCQDNEVSWVDWDRAGDFAALTAFTARLARLRREHPVFRRRRFFQGRPVRGTDLEDIAWLTPAGQPMTDAEWSAEHAGRLGVVLNGEGIPEPDARGQRLVDDSFLLMVNPSGADETFTLPGPAYGAVWQGCLDTAEDEPRASLVEAGGEVVVEAHSLRLLVRPRGS